MTKLQLLNAYLTERLAALVKEVLAVVEDTVAEYREETARTRRENESLRRQLRDILLLEAETEWLSTGCYRESTPPRTASQNSPVSDVQEGFDRKYRVNRGFKTSVVSTRLLFYIRL